MEASIQLKWYYSLADQRYNMLLLFIYALFYIQDVLSEEMSSLKSIAQQAVMNAGLENQIPSSADSMSSDTKGNSTHIIL